MFKLSQEDLKQYNVTIDSLKKYNWEYENGFAVQQVLFPNKQIVLSNGDTVSTDHFDLKEIDNQIILDMPSYLLNMNGCCRKTDQNKMISFGKNVSNVAAPPRCVDYNGPLGNGKNDEGTIQAAINFIGSTCNLAVLQGNCLKEHMNGEGGCYNTHGNKLCSELIRSSSPVRDGGLSTVKTNKDGSR